MKILWLLVGVVFLVVLIGCACFDPCYPYGGYYYYYHCPPPVAVYPYCR